MAQLRTEPRILADKRPNDYEYALMSVQVYQDVKPRNKLPGFEDWKVIYSLNGASNYFGAIYANTTTKQLVVAHRGTYSIGALIEDVRGVVLSGSSPQKHEAFALTRKALDFIQETEGDYEKYHLSFTGHSLGGFLAELCLYFCSRSFNYHAHVNAVTFESPGVRETLKALESNKEDIDYELMDVVGYVSYPNLVNTFDKHVGSLYSVHTNLGDWGNWSGWYTWQAHSIENMAAALQNTVAALAPPKEADKECKRYYLTDWPVNLQRNEFFRQFTFKGGEYTQVQHEAFTKQNEQLFKLDFDAHHHIDEQFSNNSSIALKHFSLDTQTILSAFYNYLLNSTKEFQGKLRERWQNKVPTEIIEMLLSFQLITKPSGVVMLVLTNPKLRVMHFRRRMTEWLNESGKTVLDLFPTSADEKQKHTVSIIATVLETGAVNSKEGIIYRPIVKGLSFNFPKNISEQQSKTYRELIKAVWNDIYPGIGTIKAVVVEKGAINEGPIIDAHVTGADFNFIDDSDTGEENTEKNMAELLSLLRTRDKSQPYQPNQPSLPPPQPTEAVTKTPPTSSATQKK